MSDNDPTTAELGEAVSEIDEGYEYLMAYASHAEDTGDDVAEDYVETIKQNLQTIQTTFDELGQEREAYSPYYDWTAEQSDLAIASLSLFLEHGDTSPDAVNALLSVPPLRNSLTSVLFLEEIDVL